MLTVACANVYGGCNTMAHGDFFVQPNQFDPEGDATEEEQTLWLQQDVSEWLVWLNNVSLFYVLLGWVSPGTSRNDTITIFCLR